LVRNFHEILAKNFEDFKEKGKGSICQTHNRPLEIICCDHGTRICTDCALFGKHQGHNVIAFSDALKQQKMGMEALFSAFLRLTG